MNLESGQADSLSFCSYDEIFVTKGDANKTQDLSPVPEDQLVGTYLWHVPVLGYFMRSFGGKGPAAAAAWIVILNVVVWIVEMVFKKSDQKD